MKSARAFRVLLIFLFSGYGISNGQYTFIRNLSNGVNGIYGGAFAQATNGDYLFNAAINNNNLVLLRTDSNGIKIYETLISQLPFNKVVITDAMQNGDFLLHMVNNQTFSSQPAASVNTDDVGNPVSIRKHYLPGFTKFTVASKSSSGDFFIGGAIFDGSGTDTDMILAKFDSSGNNLWTKSIGMLGSQVITTISPTYNGGCLVTGTDSSGINRYLIKFTSTGVMIWANYFQIANNVDLRPVSVHAIDSLKDYVTADNYSVTPASELVSCIMIRLDQTGMPNYHKAFKKLNNNTSIFSTRNWIYHDASNLVHLMGWGKHYNAGPGIYYDAPYYIQLNQTFGVLSTKSMSLFNCETTIVDNYHSSIDKFVQVLAVKDHSFTQVQDATTFWKFDSSVNGCINSSPLIITDTTFVMPLIFPVTAFAITHTMTDSVFAMQGTLPCNYSMFSCVPAAENEIENSGSISVYPNPATEKLFFKFPNGFNQKLNYRVYTIQGKEVKSGYCESGEIDISQLVPQTYFIRLFADDESEGFLFVKTL